MSSCATFPDSHPRVDRLRRIRYGGYGECFEPVWFPVRRGDETMKPGAAHDLLAAIPQPCATPIKPTCKSAAIAMQPISAVWLAFVASVSRGNHRRTYAPGSEQTG
jgi:hypothetical protein